MSRAPAALVKVDVLMALPLLIKPIDRLSESGLPGVLARFDGRIQGADLHPGMAVLDLGCGRGHLFKATQDAIGSEGSLIALESRRRFQAAARAHSQEHAIEFLDVDSSNTGLPSHSFDRILMHRVFHDLRDRSGTVREIHRLLKPGGKLWLWEPRAKIRGWQIQAYEGMFRGARLDKEWETNTILGYCRRYVAAEGLPGSRL